MKGVVFTLDAVFALTIAVASISILLYFNYFNQASYSIQYSNAQSVLSNLLSTQVDGLRNGSALAMAMSNQFAGANATWPQFSGGIYRNDSTDFGPIEPIISSTFTAANAITTGIIADYGNIYFAAGGTVYAVNATTNNVLWSSYTASNVASTPALYAGTLVFANSANLIALNARTGNTLWIANLPSTATSPILAYDGRIILGASNGKIYSFFAGNGTSAWTTSSSVGTSPFNITVVYGNLAVRTPGSVLMVVQTGNAANELWSAAQASAPTNLASEGPFIYFGTGSTVNAIYSNGTAYVPYFPLSAGSAVKGIGVYTSYIVYQTSAGVGALSQSNSLLWSTTAPSYFGSAVANSIPVVSRKMVYTLWSNGLAGQYLNNGTVAWFSPLPGSSTTPYMSLAYGRLYVVVGNTLIAYGACNAPMHASTLSAIAGMYLNSDPGCAEALSNAVFPSANYTVFVGNAFAHNTLVAQFNGATSYINAGNDVNLNMNGGGITMSAWAAINAVSASQRIIHKGGDSGSAYDYSLGYTSTNQIFAAAMSTTGAMTDGVMTTSTYAATGVWTHIAATYNGVTITIYVNGVQQATTSSSTSDTGNSNFVVGDRNDGTQFFNGLISDVQVYGTALSANQVQQLYQEGISGSPVNGAGIIGWWPLAGDTNDYAEFNTGYNNGVTFASQNYTSPSLANAYSISSSSVLIPLLNYATGADNTTKAGVYTWR
jgi:hypothetical protein